MMEIIFFFLRQTLLRIKNTKSAYVISHFIIYNIMHVFICSFSKNVHSHENKRDTNK